MNKRDDFENNDIEKEMSENDEKATIDDIDVSDIFGEEEIPFAIDESMISEDGYIEIARAETEGEMEEVIEGTVAEEAIEEDIEEEFGVQEESEAEAECDNEIQGVAVNKKGPKRARKKGKKQMKKKKITIIVLSIVLLILIGIVSFGYKTCQSCWQAIRNARISEEDQIYSELEKIDTSNIEQYEKINILLLGVDKEGLRCDSIMLLSYNTRSHKINLMSIPRDTRVRDDEMGRYRKINALRNTDISRDYGPVAVAKAVKNLTGMPINYYVEFSFDALDNTMDILGPVTFDVPDLEGKGRGMNYDDPVQNLHIHLKPGVQELSGNQIQQFLRYRKSNYRDAKYVDGSDQKRVERQQALLAAIIDQKLNLQSLGKIDKIFNEVGKGLKTTFSEDDIMAYAAYLAKNINNISSDNMDSVVLPGRAKTIGGASYYVADPDEIAKVVKDMFGYDVKAEELSNRINRKEGTSAMADDEPTQEEKDNEENEDAEDVEESEEDDSKTDEKEDDSEEDDSEKDDSKTDETEDEPEDEDVNNKNDDESEEEESEETEDDAEEDNAESNKEEEEEEDKPISIDD